MGNNYIGGFMDIYLYNGKLQSIDRSPMDITVIPHGASLISESCWKLLCKKESEQSLISSLSVDDIREKV